MLKTVFWVLLGLCLAMASATASTSETSVLSEQVSVLEDPGHEFSPQQALALLATTPANNKPQISLSHNTGTYWLGFTVPGGQHGQTRILDLDYIFIENAQLYRMVDDQLHLIDTIRLQDSIFERSVVYRKPAFLLELPADRNSRFILKLTLISKSNAALEIRPQIMTLTAFLKAQLAQNIAFFLLIGLFTALAVYNAILYLRIGIKGHIFYSLYLSAMVFIIACYEGLLFYLPAPPPASWVIASISIAPTLSSLFLMAFGLNVLQLKRFRPRIDRFYKGAIIFVFIGLPITFLKLNSFNFWLEITVVVLTIGLGGIAATMIKQGQKTAIYFAISFIFIAVGYGIETTLYSLPMLEILGSDLALQVIPWMEQYFFYTCSVIEVFFLALALASYIDALRVESNVAKRKVVEQLENTAKLKAEYAATLEHDVAERTSQLDVQRKVLARQNEKLLEMDRLKSQFLANISHEFRTPLTLIKGPLNRILAGEYTHDRDQLNNAVETSSRNANRLSRLMEELLTLSHLESNQLRLQVQSIEINSYCRRIASMFEHQAKERELTFSTSLLSDDRVVFFDPNKIETVLCNLLSNAFKYTPRQGNVHFAVRVEPEAATDEGQLLFSIADTGQGIPERLKDRIFDRFYRLEQDDRSGVEGSGIGLSLVRELTDLHGGQVNVHSRHAGGSDFQVSLPLGFSHYDKSEFSTPTDDEFTQSKPAIAAYTPAVARVQSNDKESRPTLLLVEDVADMRDYIASHFDTDYNVLTASDGQQALAVLEKNSVEVVVTDLMMPLMDGMELLANIRASKQTATLPVLILSARSTSADRNLALANQADDYLAKPFNSDELVLRVRNILHRQHNPATELTKDHVEMPLSADEQWLTKATQCVQQHISETSFDAVKLASMLAVSKPTLHRHMERAAQTTPAAFIRDIRLQKARELITANAYRTIAEVAYAVGFASPGYFSRLYKQRFPS